MKANVEKSHLITSKSEDIVVNIGNNAIKHTKRGKLIGVKIDYKLTLIPIFTKYIRKLVRKCLQCIVFNRTIYEY